jgi:DNA-binding transcriptional MerR regulator
MRIGELAALAGVTPDTIRYYEREGLLPPAPRTASGYREYGPEALDDLRFIRKAQALGLRLADVREVLEISSGGRPPCEHVRATVSTRLAEVERRLRELRALRATLRETLERLDRVPPPEAGCRCSVIEGVDADGRDVTGAR